MEPRVGAHWPPRSASLVSLRIRHRDPDGLRRASLMRRNARLAPDAHGRVLKSWTRRMNKDEAHLGRTVAVSEAEKTKYVLVDGKNGRRRAAPVHACCPAEAVNRTP